MRFLLMALAALFFQGMPAQAQVQPDPVSIFSGKLKSVGYCQMTSLATSKAITTANCATGSVPTSYTVIDLIVEGQGVRYRTDGVAPTATVGMPLAIGVEKFFVVSNPSAIHFISQSSGSIINLEFFQ